MGRRGVAPSGREAVKRTLLFLPHLIHVAICVVVVLIATPLLALLRSRRHPLQKEEPMTIDTKTLLSAYPPPRGHYGAEATDHDMLDDLQEWARSAKTLLESLGVEHDIIETALDDAGVPRVEKLKDQDGCSEQTLDQIARVRLVIEALLWCCDTFHQLHASLNTKADDLSARYNRAADDLQALTEQRDKALAQAEHVEGWRAQCVVNERTTARLTAKVKRIETAGKPRPIPSTKAKQSSAKAKATKRKTR